MDDAGGKNVDRIEHAVPFGDDHAEVAAARGLYQRRIERFVVRHDFQILLRPLDLPDPDLPVDRIQKDRFKKPEDRQHRQGENEEDQKDAHAESHGRTISLQNGIQLLSG